jgi:hypothetical protein
MGFAVVDNAILKALILLANFHTCLLIVGIRVLRIIPSTWFWAPAPTPGPSYATRAITDAEGRMPDDRI